MWVTQHVDGFPKASAKRMHTFEGDLASVRPRHREFWRAFRVIGQGLRYAQLHERLIIPQFESFIGYIDGSENQSSAS
jgi:hypothetical protein